MSRYLCLFIFFMYLSNCPSLIAEEYLCDRISSEDQGEVIYDQKFIGDFDDKFLDWGRVKSIYAGHEIKNEILKDSETPFLNANNYITIKNKEEFFSYYVNQKKSIGTLDCANFITGSLDLSGFLQIGQSFEFYQKKWNIKNSAKIIQITNLERVEIIRLYFSNSKLSRITYKLVYKG